MKKKKRKVRVSKKDVGAHRKLLRKRRTEDSERPVGIHFDEERYLQAVSNIKRKILQIEENILFLLHNAEPAKDTERRQDLQYAYEYCGFARQNLGATEYFCTDDIKPTKTKKGKLNRPKKKGKRNRRR